MSLFKSCCYLTATLLCLLLTSGILRAQGYHAINGSPFAGSTGIRNNPASPVNSVHKWDLTLFTLQAKLSNNTLYLDNFSLKTHDNAELKMKDGYYSRYGHTNIDASLLNFHYKFNDKKAVAFNLRARTYNHVKTYALTTSDSVYNLHDFVTQNRTTPFFEGFATHSGWLEGDLNYSQVLKETSTSRLTGGITLQIMKSLSGAFARISRLSYLENKSSTDTTYTFTHGAGSFGYSGNYDETAPGSGSTGFFKNALTSFGLSMGIEYLIYDTDPYASQVNNNLNYSWKIGVSLMDLGANAFKTSANSIQFANLNPNVTDILVDNKLKDAETIQQFRDSLATLFTTASTPDDKFSISNPTRLVINVDKRLGNNLYVNGDLSLNFYSSASYKRLRTRELNLLTITPRWETLAWGVYLPVQYNTQGQLWLGAAIKLGPLLLGIHDLKVLQKNPALNGGGYLMLSVHPFNKKKVISKLDCPD